MKPPALFLHSFSPAHLSDTLSATALLGLSQRALLMANENDCVCCDIYPDSDYLHYLHDFGIVAKRIIVPIEKENASLAERLRDDNDLLSTLTASTTPTSTLTPTSNNQKNIVEPYIASDTEWDIANKLAYDMNGTVPDYLAYLNQKTSLNEVLTASDLPSLPMINCRAKQLEATALPAYQRYGKLVIRASLGLGSSNVWLVHNKNDIKAIQASIISAAYPDERRYVITPFIANTLSLNVQFLLSATSVDFIGISQQQIDANLNYSGNIKLSSPLPLQQQLLTQTKQLAHYLHQSGYRGYIGFDLIVNNTQVFIIEINPRVNSSTFTFIGVKRIMGSLETACFASASLAIPKSITSFQHFERSLQTLLLRPNSNRGILPTMNPIADRNIDIIAIAPSGAEITDLLNKARQQLQKLSNS